MDKEHDEINDLLTLYYGGRKFEKWNPFMIGKGEGQDYPRPSLAQGPGLYVGNKIELAKVYLNYGGDNPSEHAKGGKVHSDAAFIGYLSPHGKFESYPESVAKENDYHHSNTIKDLDAYNQEGGLTFVRMGGEPVVTIKGEHAIDPHHPKHSPIISDLARRLISFGAHPSMPFKVDNMGFKQHEAPYQGKHIGTIEEWTQRNKKAEDPTLKSKLNKCVGKLICVRSCKMNTLKNMHT